MIKLSPRLNLAYSLVPRGSSCADIGADHGYLIGSLMENKIIKKGFAVENKIGPFNVLKNNLLELGINNIECSLSSGLNLLPSDIDTVLILGMGGDTIIDILLEDKEKLKNVNNLIISAHSKNYELRKCITELGYKITDQKCIFDPYPHYYEVTLFTKGISLDSSLDLRFSRILKEKSDKNYLRYYQDEINKYQDLLKNTSLPKERIDSIKEEIKLIKDYINL